MEKQMILFTGIQASGKTTFYKLYFREYEHVSLDVLNTRNKERLAIESCLSQGRSFVVDNTNPERADREKYISLARANGYRIIGYYFQSGISDCIARNEMREGKAKVPRCAIAATSNKMELPDWSEGYDELYYVSIKDGQMTVEEWRTESGRLSGKQRINCKKRSDGDEV